MKVSLQPMLNDPHVDAQQPTSQRQLSISLTAQADGRDRQLPLNLCLILDHSGSMGGQPLKTVKEAAVKLLDNLTPQDRLAVIAFDHRAKVLIPNQALEDLNPVKKQIEKLQAEGGTAIDEGLKLGMEELSKGKTDRVSQVFLLTDGENEHGDNDRCLKLAKMAADYNITLNTLGFGDNWNQDVLEAIADAAGGQLKYIAQANEAQQQFSDLFQRAQAVGLTNAFLLITLEPGTRLADLKPIAQVAPDTIELPPQNQGSQIAVRLGDLLKDDARIVLVNMYLGQLPPGNHAIAQIQVRYDDPALGQTGLLSEKIPITVEVQSQYQPQPNPQVQQSILALAKYRQTQLAEAKLNAGDRQGAATLLQSAAKTALQLGDKQAATVLQTNATRLQDGQELSDADRKKTRIVAKTMLQE